MMVRLLSKEERVEELARMLGGIEITKNTLAHAQEMLDRHLKTEVRDDEKL